MMHILSVNAPAHIQDLGRFGQRRFGIGHAGAMDTLALQAGNLLLGNEAGAAAVEISLGGMSVRFDRDTPFCISGAFYEAELDGTPVYSYWRHNAKAGQTLHLKRAVYGMHGYLCVAGGIDVAPVLGSRSTDFKAGFGGLGGRVLQTGDCLALGDGASFLPEIGIAPPVAPAAIRLLPSSEHHAFGTDAQQLLVRQNWTLQSDSNRMGYRFKGNAPLDTPSVEMLSHAVCAGTVQVPPNGLPIILMADAQTTGGYPKIACVAAADLGHLAQIRFGSSVRFCWSDAAEAARLRRKNQAYLNQIKRICDEHR